MKHDPPQTFPSILRLDIWMSDTFSFRSLQQIFFVAIVHLRLNLASLPRWQCGASQVVGFVLPVYLRSGTVALWYRTVQHITVVQYSTLLWYSKCVVLSSLFTSTGLCPVSKQSVRTPDNNQGIPQNTHSDTLSLLDFLFGAVRIRFSDFKDVSWFIWLMVLPNDTRATFHLYLQGIVITGNSCNYNDLLSFWKLFLYQNCRISIT